MRINSQTCAILFALCSVSLAPQTYGTVIMIRHPPEIDNRIRVQNIACKSEDDGSAMVWNKEPYEANDKLGFGTKYPKFEDCGSVDCIKWSEFSDDWHRVESIEKPMAPVFDYRWEAFSDYRDNEFNALEFKDPKESGSIVFSARGSGNITIWLTGNNSSSNDSCFALEFAHETQQSVPTISSCNGKESATSQLPQEKLNPSRITPLEWRTYMIKWENDTKIEAFHGTKSLVEKKAPGKLKFKFAIINKSSKQHLRFHDYTYKWTHISNISISSHSFICSERKLMVELVVSLCPECRIEVQLIDANNISLVNRFFDHDKHFMEYELSSWQLVRLDTPCDENHKNITLKMLTIIKGTGHEGMWAVGSPIRRISGGNLRQDSKKFTSMTDLSCQKLSYDAKESTTVYSTKEITNINSNILRNCVNKSAEGFCDFGCHNLTCSKTSICNKRGCTCVPGFKGNNCDQDCPTGSHGYNCEQRCGCLNHRACDKVTGRCRDNCQDYYLPSACAKKLGPPTVKCINESVVELSYNIKIFNENETKHLNFEIKVGGQWKGLNISIDPRTSSWFWPDESIKILEMRKDYKVRAVINETYGEEGSFNTNNWKLSKPEYLAVTPMPNGTMRLRWAHRPHVWEKVIKNYEVNITFLGSLEKRQDLLMTNTTTHPFVVGKYVYEKMLDLEKGKNYSFSVKPMHNSTDNRAVEVMYVLPNEASLANIKVESGYPPTKQLIITLSSSQTATKEETVNLAMKRSCGCPVLKSNETSRNVCQKTDTRFKWLYDLNKGEYPACELRYNVAYVFTVGPDDEKLSSLCWLLILPIAVVCSIVLYVLYRKHWAGEWTSTTEDRDSFKLLTLGDEEQKLNGFENYVKKAADNGDLQQQFVALPRGMVQPCEYGKLPENIRKNRYRNLIAYDETRVLLIKDSSGVHSDYINANWIQGYCKEKAYIATQGPLPNTVIDFWRMIWQEEVRIICMLVDLVENEREMCTRYWPEVGEEKNYGDIVVLTIDQRVLADYTYRTFLISKGSGMEPQRVEHLQYTGWPQEGVPMYSHSVVEYLEKLLSVSPGQGPIVVHCDSGAGRTGAIILCDICRRCLTVDGTVDVFAEAKKMFKARGNMLRNFAQYVLAHLVPTQCLLMLPTKVLCANITQESIDKMKRYIPEHMKRLADTSWMDKALRGIEPLRPTNEENILKNRFKNRIPVGPSLVTLSRYPEYDNNSDYISAVTVDGVKIRKQYIASQLPMPSTLTDFWRLIVEKNVELMMILQQPDLEDPTCCDIIPRGTTVVPVPGLKVETKTTTDSNPHFTLDKLLISDISRGPAGTRSITALTCKNWNPIKNAQPPDPAILAEIWRASEKIHRHGPTLVLCHDGLTGCGLYLAMSFMLERMAVEHECDVVVAVRAVRRSRSDYVRAQWQFEYLYEAALKYTESFQDYSNWSGITSLGQRYE